MRSCSVTDSLGRVNRPNVSNTPRRPSRNAANAPGRLADARHSGVARMPSARKYLLGEQLAGHDVGPLRRLLPEAFRLRQSRGVARYCDVLYAHTERGKRVFLLSPSPQPSPTRGEGAEEERL